MFSCPPLTPTSRSGTSSPLSDGASASRCISQHFFTRSAYWLGVPGVSSVHHHYSFLSFTVSPRDVKKRHMSRSLATSLQIFCSCVWALACQGHFFDFPSSHNRCRIVTDSSIAFTDLPRVSLLHVNFESRRMFLLLLQSRFICTVKIVSDLSFPPWQSAELTKCALPLHPIGVVVIKGIQHFFLGHEASVFPTVKSVGGRKSPS